eukprot:5995509-Pleurochrysis_carterae.AAC.1
MGAPQRELDHGRASEHGADEPRGDHEVVLHVTLSHHGILKLLSLVVKVSKDVRANRGRVFCLLTTQINGGRPWHRVQWSVRGKGSPLSSRLRCTNPSHRV